MSANTHATTSRARTDNRTLIMLAFACDPTQGSEPGAGWVALEAASRLFSSIVVVTRLDAHSELEVRAEGLPARVTIVRLATPFDRRGPVYARYLAWNIRAALYVTSRLKRDLPVATIHHVTYASDWMYSPLSFVRRDLLKDCWVVWGPVGGGTYAPADVIALFPRSFRLRESIRRLSTTTLRRLTLGAHRRRVDVAVALNQDSANLMTGFRRLVTSPNVVLDYDSLPAPTKDRERVALFAGRPLEWKGIRLAIEAHRASRGDWGLELYGGTAAEFQEFGLLDDPGVRAVGRVRREDLLQRLSEVGVLILPSVHDSAPWIAAEAASLGVSVVCLDLGGVATMAGNRAVVVPTSPADTLVSRLSEAVSTTLQPTAHAAHVAPQTQLWTKDAFVTRLRDWYGMAS